jgi:hypothetical protein
VADPWRKQRNPAGGDESPAGRFACRVFVKRLQLPLCVGLLLLPWLSPGAERSAPTEGRSGAKEKRGRANETRDGRVVSAHLTEAIRAQLPAFKPVPPASPTPVAAEVGALGKEDGPIILERVVVTEEKAPGMEEFQMLTKAGQTAYLQKLFPGAVTPLKDPLDESTPNFAAQMLRDKRREESLSKWSETIATFRAVGDVTGSNRLKEEMQRALVRSYDWRDERLDKSYNNGRR